MLCVPEPPVKTPELEAATRNDPVMVTVEAPQVRVGLPVAASTVQIPPRRQVHAVTIPDAARNGECAREGHVIREGQDAVGGYVHVHGDVVEGLAARIDFLAGAPDTIILEHMVRAVGEVMVPSTTHPDSDEERAASMVVVLEVRVTFAVPDQ